MMMNILNNQEGVNIMMLPNFPFTIKEIETMMQGMAIPCIAQLQPRDNDLGFCGYVSCPHACEVAISDEYHAFVTTYVMDDIKPTYWMLIDAARGVNHPSAKIIWWNKSFEATEKLKDLIKQNNRTAKDWEKEDKVQIFKDSFKLQNKTRLKRAQEELRKVKNATGLKKKGGKK